MSGQADSHSAPEEDEQMSQEQSLFVSQSHPQDRLLEHYITPTNDTNPSISAGKKRKPAGPRNSNDRISPDLASETLINSHLDLLDSGAAFQFARASSSDHIGHTEPPSFSATLEPTSSAMEKRNSLHVVPIAIQAILRSWPDEIRMPIIFRTEDVDCNTPLPAFPEGAKFHKTSVELFPVPLSTFFRTKEILTAIPWQIEPPIIVFGAWVSTDIPATHGIPEGLRKSTTAAASIDDGGITGDTSALVYLPRLAILKDGGNGEVESCASGIALYMAKASDVVSMLRSCLRIAASWGHIGLILDFASLLKSLVTSREIENQERRSELVGALVKVFKEAEFTGRWKLVILLSPDWEDTSTIGEKGLDGLIV